MERRGTPELKLIAVIIVLLTHILQVDAVIKHCSTTIITIISIYSFSIYKKTLAI